MAGIISLLGLIIAKEQKVSDFRQAWIDALRSEITSYLTQMNAIADLLEVSYQGHEDKLKALSAPYQRLNEAHFMITLRLNPKEKRSQDLLELMAEFQQCISEERNPNAFSNFKRIEQLFLSTAKDLLKSEWGRVKRGEPTFQFAKYLTTLCVFVLIAFIGIRAAAVAFGQDEAPPPAIGDSQQVPLVETQPQPKMP